QPYILVAAQTGADELAIGTEFQSLEQAPTALWQQLIEQIHTVFPGMLTYDMNWTYLHHAFPEWMYHRDLAAIGVSTYYPLIFTPQRLDPQLLPSLWRDKVKKYLDGIALQLD